MESDDNAEEIFKVSLTPASINIITSTPRSGWWDWTIEFREELCIGGRIVPWGNAGASRRCFSMPFACSDVFDPVPALWRFINCLEQNVPFCEWVVDEEGSFVSMQVQSLEASLIRLRFFSNLRYEEFDWEFLLDKSAFIAELNTAHSQFVEYGGWRPNSRDEHKSRRF